MKTHTCLMAAALGISAVVSMTWATATWAAPPAKAPATPEAASVMIVHNVYFSLKESTPENREQLAAGCKQYLSQHPGTVFYACGTVSDLSGAVNDRDFDVGLHVVFEDRAAHDKYQVSADHLKFIAEFRPMFSKVRVFDCDAAK